jgi:hypothetical protein
MLTENQQLYQKGFFHFALAVWQNWIWNLQISIYTWAKIPECLCRFAQTTIFCSGQVLWRKWEIYMNTWSAQLYSDPTVKQHKLRTPNFV